MTSDPGAEFQPSSRPLDVRLPAIRGVRVRRVVVRPPERRNLVSTLPPSEDAVEIEVDTEFPIPIRAMGPVLYVGDVALTEAVAVSPTTYRFTGLDRGALPDGAPLALGWTGDRRESAPDGEQVYHEPE